MTTVNPTPMLRQYQELKQQHPGTLLFFRLGDFYELFFDDAVTGRRELQIPLTARHKERGDPVPMCGVPHHSASGYIARLVRKGYRVAICEQTEDAAKTKKLVRREVVRVVTPGTPIDPQLLEPRESVFLAAVCATGESSPASSNSSSNPTLSSFFSQRLFEAVLTPIDDWLWQTPECAAVLRRQFGVRSLEGYGVEGKTEAIRAAGACLRYAQETQRAAAAHVTDLIFFAPQDHLVLDSITVRNLELVESLGGAGGRSLLDIIDETVTGMGARLLRSWLLRPSVRKGEVEARLAAVADLHSSHQKRDRLRALLKEVSDLERLTGRINLGSATPRDLNAIMRSLNQVPALREELSETKSSLLQVLHENIDELGDVRDLIARAVNDEPPAKLSDGDTIREGHASERDELRSISRNAKQIIATLEATERTRSGIGSLRIRYNNVFGYYIEVSKANAAHVPMDYERRQTLANAERYTTPELKDWEKKVLGAEERIIQIETELFNELCRQIAAQTKRLQATAHALAAIDALAALAEAAVRRDRKSTRLNSSHGYISYAVFCLK